MACKSASRSFLFAAAVLTFLPLIWWWPVFTGHLPDFMDTVAHGYPIRMAAAQQIREGTLPLWLPNVFAGTPLAANPQLTVWYPPQLLFYILPSTLTYGLFAILHYVIGGLGMFAFVRRVTGRNEAALFAAFTFQFGSMLISRIALLPHVLSTVWVPWMFWAVELALREKGLRPGRGTLLTALFFCLQILAGSPQITYYTALALPVYWLGRALMTASPGERLRSLAATLGRGLTAALLGVLMSSIQLVPMMELAGQTSRTAIDHGRLAGQALNGEFIWRSLIGFTGDLVEDTDSINAIGAGAMLLIPLAFMRKRNRGTAALLFLIGFVGWVLALGPFTRIWAAILPMADHFHAPRRSLIFWSICGPAVAGIGAANLVALLRRRRLARVAASLALLLLTAGTIWMLPRLDRVWTTEERLLPDNRVTRILGTDRFVVIDPTLRYSYDSRRFDFGKSMAANLSCLHGTMAVNGYDPLVPERLGLALRVACQHSGVFYPSHGAFFTDPASPVLKLLNVNYVVGRWDLFEPGRVIQGTAIDKDFLSRNLELVSGSLRWPVYRFLDERPLAWVPGRLVSVSTAEDALYGAVAEDPARFAFNEEGLELTAPDGTSVSAQYSDARTIRLNLQGAPRRETPVCVAVNWMPGWKARSEDGQPLLTFPVDGVITGVIIPSGVSEVTLQYAPASFWQGLVLSLAGLLLWSAFLRQAKLRDPAP